MALSHYMNSVEINYMPKKLMTWLSISNSKSSSPNLNQENVYFNCSVKLFVIVNISLLFFFLSLLLLLGDFTRKNYMTSIPKRTFRGPHTKKNDFFFFFRLFFRVDVDHHLQCWGLTPTLTCLSYLTQITSSPSCSTFPSRCHRLYSALKWAVCHFLPPFGILPQL